MQCRVLQPASINEECCHHLYAMIGCCIVCIQPQLMKNAATTYVQMKGGAINNEWYNHMQLNVVAAICIYRECCNHMQWRVLQPASFIATSTAITYMQWRVLQPASFIVTSTAITYMHRKVLQSVSINERSSRFSADVPCA